VGGASALLAGELVGAATHCSHSLTSALVNSFAKMGMLTSMQGMYDHHTQRASLYIASPAVASQ